MKISRREFFKDSLVKIPFLFSIVGIPGIVLAIFEKNDKDIVEKFFSNKVQAHIRAGNNYISTKFFNEVNFLLKSIGANVITRHFKSSGEGAWWFSKYGKINEKILKLNKNIAKEIITDAHKKGLLIIAYYRHMEDNFIARKHPNWLCRNWQGEPIKTITHRGYYLCLNSPYRNFIKNRLIELANMKIDGFYFDETHMPRNGCWCIFCKNKFKKIYNLNPPKKPNPKDIIWAKYYIDFNNKTIENAFKYWKKAIKSVNKKILFIISLNFYPTLQDHHLSSRLMQISDSSKSELKQPIMEKEFFLFKNPKNIKFNKEIKIALGFSILRDGTNGKSAHIWIPEIVDNFTGILSVGGVITYGNIANVNIYEKFLMKNNVDFYKNLFKMNNTLLPIFRNMIPLNLVGIIFSENSRNFFIPNYKKAFYKVIYPIYKAYKICFEKNLPISVNTDQSMLTTKFKNEQIIFLPSFIGLNKKQVKKLELLEKEGKFVTTDINKVKYFIEYNIKFPLKILSSNYIHVGIFKNQKNYNPEIYIFFTNKFSWIGFIGYPWQNRGKYKKPEIKDILIKIIIRDNKFFENINNIELISNFGRKKDALNKTKRINFYVKTFSILKISLKSFDMEEIL